MGDAETVAVVGRPRWIAFPAVCANCARPASGRLRIQKAFAVEGKNVIVTVKPRFCPECIAASRKERRPAPWVPVKRVLYGWFLWIPIAGSFLAGWLALGNSFQWTPGMGLTGIFWGITAWCCYLLWRQTRHLAVRPPDTITSAVDFTSDESDTFEPQWRKFIFRNAEYAERFREANEKRLWSRRHPAARRASELRFWANWIFAAALVVAGIFWIADELGIPLWDHIVRAFR